MHIPRGGPWFNSHKGTMWASKGPACNTRPCHPSLLVSTSYSGLRTQLSWDISLTLPCSPPTLPAKLATPSLGSQFILSFPTPSTKLRTLGVSVCESACVRSEPGPEPSSSPGPIISFPGQKPLWALPVPSFFATFCVQPQVGPVREAGWKQRWSLPEKVSWPWGTPEQTVSRLRTYGQRLGKQKVFREESPLLYKNPGLFSTVTNIPKSGELHAGS